MNCNEYLEQYLTAHADGQLAPDERHSVEQHLRGCTSCRARLIEEQVLKAQVRRYAGLVKTPADVRLRIRALLGEASERPQRSTGYSAVRVGSSRHPLSPAALRSSARVWLSRQLQYAQYVAPIGLLMVLLSGATVLSRLYFRSMPGLTIGESQKSIPAFDFAIERFNGLSQEFAPNVPPEAFSRNDGAYFAWVEDTNPVRHVSAELPDISMSYEKMQMSPEFCDFALAGYKLVGGRVERAPDGKVVTYTLYRNQTGSILSIGLKQQIAAPQGGYWFGTHAFYSYHDYSICLTIDPVGHFASIILTRSPMVELLRDVAVSDVTTWDR